MFLIENKSTTYKSIGIQRLPTDAKAMIQAHQISDLSNGTKAKLILMKFVLDKCDVLLLDEPTRNVSPLSNPVIRKILKEFKGTIISVSHDRKYIKEVVNKIYSLTDKGLVLLN